MNEQEKKQKEEAKEREKKQKEEAKSNADLEKEKEKAAQKIKKEAEQERASQEKIRQKQLKKQLKKQTAESEAVEEDEEYEKMKEEFNQTHIKILEQALYINKSTDGELIPMTRKHLMDAYEHMTYGDRKSFIKRWLTDDSIPKKRKMDVVPTGLPCPPDIFNLWTPFACEEEYKFEETQEVREGVEFLLSHIKLLCSEDEAVYDYVFKWISHLLLYPQHKTRMLTLISEQGGGKNSVVDMIQAMIGVAHVFVTTMPSRDVWGQFNERMKGDTYLVVLNELSQKEQKDAFEHIKHLQTEPTLTINPKGKACYDIRSYHKFIALSNNEEPVRTSKGDRRNMIIRCSDDLIGNTSHFNRFHELLRNKDVVFALYDYFRMYKPSEVKIFHTLKNEDVPITAYQQELTSLSFNPVEEFINWLISDTEYLDGETEIPLTFTRVMELFEEFKDKTKIKYDANSKALGSRLARLNIKGINKERKNFGMIMTFHPVHIKEHFLTRQK